MIGEYSDLTCDGPDSCGNRFQIRTPRSRKEMLSHVGLPCPECGKDMLTRAAALTGWRILCRARLAYRVLRLLGMVRKTGESARDGDAKIRVQLSTTPDGGVKLKRASAEIVGGPK